MFIPQMSGWVKRCLSLKCLGGSSDVYPSNVLVGQVGFSHLKPGAVELKTNTHSPLNMRIQFYDIDWMMSLLDVNFQN